MHQLAKYPDAVISRGPATPSSPRRILTLFEQTSCLDYCSEMLATVSRVSALHMQNFNDHVNLRAVNDIEDLTTASSRKILQKIVILGMLVVPAERGEDIPG